ncbi:MAG: hypothetical protein KC503_14680 [Myxococcales bacterium]|nr:hypothetical protein [Myxococcales bacterium]
MTRTITIAALVFGFTLIAGAHSTPAEAKPRVARWVSNVVARQVAKRAWHKHARQQVRSSNESVHGQRGFIPQIFRSAHIANAKPSADGKHTNFDGHFSWTTGRGGSGIAVGPIPARVSRGTTLTNLKRLIGRAELPQVELQPMHALEATGARR